MASWPAKVIRIEASKIIMVKKKKKRKYKTNTKQITQATKSRAGINVPQV